MQTGFRLNLTPIKEGLGFIKVVEWLTAVFAFASCCGFAGRNIISLFCDGGVNKTLSASFRYPFRLNQVVLTEANITLCNHTLPETRLVGDFSSSVEFFVAVGVLAFLYCTAALIVYLGYMHVYQDSDFGPMCDFVVTAAFTFLWLVCSSAWARGLQMVKFATGTEGIAGTLLPCQSSNAICQITEFASMRTLDVSVVFGYLNLIVWGCNAWFVYKETRWHSRKLSSRQGAGQGRGPRPSPTPI